MSQTGTVTSFNRATGSGVLQPDADGRAITFRKDDFRQPGGDPRERMRLCYDLVKDAEGQARAFGQVLPGHVGSALEVAEHPRVVQGMIDEKECKRRYAHIRDFERMLAETGTGSGINHTVAANTPMPTVIPRTIAASR